MPERTGEHAARHSLSEPPGADRDFAAELEAPAAQPSQADAPAVTTARPSHPDALEETTARPSQPDAPEAPAARPSQPDTLEEPALPRPVGEARSPINLARLAWLVTVATLLAGTVTLALRGDVGYAIVAAVVALSAAINLL